MASSNCVKNVNCIFLTVFLISFTLGESVSKYSYWLEEERVFDEGTIAHVPLGDRSHLVKRDAPTSSSPIKKAVSANSEKKVKQKTSPEVVNTTTDAPANTVKTTKPVTPTPTLVTSWLPDLPEDTPTNNFTRKEDSHNYYNSTTYLHPEEAMSFWVNLTNENVTEHPLLSNSYRRAATVTLSFDFPFHGHIIRNITIATGGFLYTGNIMHTWLAATQYIAPLMANIDTSVHNDSAVRYFDNGTSFTVEWDDVYLQDKNKDGPFSFQVTLKDNGDIIFVYRKVQVPVMNIDEESHPVKVGLSDAYIIDKTIFFIRRKTIYEYNRIDKKVVEISNKTAIYFTALPTCLDFKTCDTCLAADTTFECSWCSAVQRCSSGLDRGRQEWMTNQCNEHKTEDCSATTVKPTTTMTVPASATTKSSTNVTTPTTTASSAAGSVTPTTSTTHAPPEVITLPHTSRAPSKGKASAQVSDGSKGNEVTSVGAGAVIAILLIVALVLGFSVWVVYAYKFPQTPSGQLLIKYRPSQWRLRHGEARYTAASIHI